jgi:hypothetical protein
MCVERMIRYAKAISCPYTQIAREEADEMKEPLITRGPGSWSTDEANALLEANAMLHGEVSGSCRVP